MRTLRTIRSLAVVVGMLAAYAAQSQVTLPTNNSGAADYVGCDNTSPFPLQIRQNDNWPIQFFTDARFRMLLNPSITYGTLGSFTNIPADGFALITPNTSFLSAVKGPFSRVHLAEGTGGNAQSIGYRLWQRNGITFTGNGDQGYIGHKYKDEDYTDMIIQWSDNPGNSRPDNTVSQFVMARSRHTAHRAKRIVSRAFTTSNSSPALGLS